MKSREHSGGAGWKFRIDRGGTFTDIVALDPQGRPRTRKLLSENPEQYEDAALQGIRDLMGVAPTAPIPAELIAEVRLGTTVGTNALLEKKGEPVVFVVTAGHGDCLRIGYQNRPDIFAREIKLPHMLYRRVIEARERIDAAGRTITPLDETQLESELRAAREEGFRSCAVVFMHSYLQGEHERRAGEIAARVGFEHISLSHELVPLRKLIRRGDTTVVDAYLSPVLNRYVNRLRAELGDTRLLFMQSNGGLVHGDSFRGKDSLLSGPAGGVVGAAAAGREAGHGRVIGFDMGGTSTDVFQFAGEYEYEHESEIAGVRLNTPMLRIHTVAAGGGSILTFDAGRFRVGPASAGANPGPACYRRGGPLTVTDANLVLGRIQADFFPRVFGPDGDKPPDPEIPRRLFAAMAERVAQETGRKTSVEETARGFLNVAVENMALAVKKISVQRGHDVELYTLNSFGGAGGQHACAIADSLGMHRVLLHPLAGVLSAYGIGRARIRRVLEQTLNEDGANAREVIEELKRKGRDMLAGEGLGPEEMELSASVMVRYAGSDSSVEVPWPDESSATGGEQVAGFRGAIRREFENRHRTLYGFAHHESEIVLESVQVQAAEQPRADGAVTTPIAGESRASGAAAPARHVSMYVDGNWTDVPAFRRKDLTDGMGIAGPALIVSDLDTVVLDSGWRCASRFDGVLELERESPRAGAREESEEERADPVRLEIFNSVFRSIAEEMGIVLRNTSSSVNIKERLDFSCALFDEQGRLVANAPHIPVHLGSMSESVAAVRRGAEPEPGDVFVLNNPYDGGTHLPDVTVVTPIFLNERGEPRLAFYTASRGHHADIGGITPGSMPPHSKHIDEEGVLIEVRRLVRRGDFLEDEMRALLMAGPHPARNPERNLADLKAQVAANRRGEELLRRLVEEHGANRTRAYMGYVRDNAAYCTRRALAGLSDGEASMEMDTGETIRVRISIQGDRARLDFTGTSPMSENNFNAPASITRAVVLYVFRTLVDDDIPLNSGCMEPLEIILPDNCLLNASRPAAVVAGNVETSQMIADVLYAALGRLACSQGTMNNFTFGDGEHQYYETICGGAGAGPDFHGADTVQTHMTNSRLTDPEVLETRFPVLVEEFRRREPGGGEGRFHGGRGVLRRIRFRAPMTAAILSGRRRVAPPGLAGGAPGLPGRNYVLRESPSGITREELSGLARVELSVGDALVIETPGGGGFGESET